MLGILGLSIPRTNTSTTRLHAEKIANAAASFRFLNFSHIAHPLVRCAKARQLLSSGREYPQVPLETMNF